MQTASPVNSGTRFLALSAIMLTAFSAPSRADDWATVRADGSVTRGSTPSAATTTSPERDSTYDGPNANNSRRVKNGRNDSDDDVRHLRPGNNRPGRNRSPRNRVVERNSYVNPGYIYGAPNYGTQTYSYGAPIYGYYPPVNQTIVIPPPVIYSAPIGGPPAFPWVKQPWITSIPLGGTVYTSPNYAVPGYPAPNYAQPGVPYWAYPQTQTNGVHGSVTIGRSGSSVTIGGHRQSTGTYYHGSTHNGYSRRR